MLDKLSEQFSLEEKYHKNQQLKKIKTFVSTYLLESVEASDFKKFLESLIAHLIIQKRASVSTMVGLLKSHRASLQEVADWIQEAVDLKWVTWDGESLITQFSLNQETIEEMNRYMFPLPLIVQPAVVHKWYDSGYYSDLSKHLKGITGVKSHSGDFCPDVLNKQNSIALSVEERVFEHAPCYLKNIHNEQDNFKKRQKLGQFNKFMSSTSQVVNTLLEVSDELYLTHFYDKRGRLYCRGYHVDYQGFDWQKAYVVFANKELITE